MPEIEATTQDQVQQFLDDNGGVAVVDCYATWCGPCKVIAPYVHKKSESTGIPLIKVDVEKAEELSKAYKIQAMPTFLVIQNKWNNVVGNIVGGGEPNVDKIFTIAKNSK